MLFGSAVLIMIGIISGKTFQAEASVATYTVKFESNGSRYHSDLWGAQSDVTGSMSNQKFTCGTLQALKSNTFKRKGYTFTGWNTKSNGSGTAYTDKQAVLDLTTTNGGTVTLYAQWELETYNITYVLNGGKNSTSNPATYNITLVNDSAGYFDYPTRTYYTFDGWYKNSDFTTKFDRIPQRNTGDITVYAKWVPIKYSIKYSLDGGANNSANPNQYNIESETILLKSPTRTGYRFVGWYTKSNYSESSRITSIPSGSTGDMNLFAKWEILTYNINYILNGGTNNTINPSSYTIKAGKILLGSPTKSGYTFQGWFTKSDFSDTRVYNIPEGSLGDKTFYAKWSLNTYRITYELNDGINDPANPKAYYVTTPDITLKSPTKENYIFCGWYEKSDFSGNKVTTIPNGSTGNKTLYAKWTPDVTYSISYVLGGGTNNPANPTSYKYISDTITLASPTHTGYIFAGWYTSNTYSVRVYNIPAGSTGNKIFYAKWTLNSYTISYELNGGKNNSANPSKYNITSSDIALNDPTRDGYTFGGWFTQSDFSGGKVTSIPKGSTGNKAFYAKWLLNTYFITYDLNFGTNDPANPSSYTTESNTITFASPTRKGYTFYGWFTDYRFYNSIRSIPTGSTGDKTLYAKWELTNYTITYELNNGINNQSNPKSYNIVTDTITLFNPTRDRYTFSGWYTNSDFLGSSIASIPKGSTGNIKLYAKWTPTVYKITYNLYGTNNPNNPTSYTYFSDTITLADPTRRGYTFVGWFTSSDFSGSKVTSIPKNSTGDKKFYAKWEVNYYTIKLPDNMTAIYGFDNKPAAYGAGTINVAYGATVGLKENDGYKVIGDVKIGITVVEYDISKEYPYRFSVTGKTNITAVTGNHVAGIMPTCVEDGNIEYYEGSDGNLYKDTLGTIISLRDTVIPASGHEYKATIVEPTCTSKGYTNHKCSRCEDEYNDTETDMLAHSFGDWRETTAPTCTAKGVETRKCKNCEATETRDIKALGHDYKDTVVAPTCTAKGYTNHKCTRCSDEYNDTETDMIAHSFGDWRTTTEPTCTANGVETRTCSVCKASELREINALGHDYVASIVPPTCTSKGYTNHKCTRCTDEYNDTETDMIAHSFGDWTVTTAPTCTDKGVETRKCKNCKATETREVKALGHDYKATVVAPTCTAKGYTLHKCSRCEDFFKDTYTDSTGHSFGDWRVTSDPTCTAKGVETRKCKNCEATEARDVKALGHDYKDTVVAPTCTSRGYTHHKCTRCNDEYNDNDTEMTAHSFGDWAVTTAPTCTAKGVETRKCNNCEETETRDVDAHGHKWSEWKTTAFDVNKGTSTQTRTCSECNKTESKTTKNAVQRLAGSGRYETAAKISQASFTTAETVVLAYGLNYADALAGVSLATKLKAPILLTNTKSLDGTTLAEIKRLKAKNVIILGGEGAISTAVETSLKNEGLATERIAGASRFGTATAIAEKLNENPTDVFFVYAFNSADALSVSPIAACKNAPIIYLSTKGDLHPDTAAYLAKLKKAGCVKNAYVIGGTGVISDDMMSKAAKALGLSKATRIAGANRFATCVAVNEKFADVLDGDMICVATGMDFPDALAGGVYAALNKAPLFLINGKLKTPQLTAEQKAYLKAKSAGKITAFGGTGVVPDSHIADIAKNSI